MLKAKDIMNTDVVTVSPDMTVEELGRLFITKRISGVPVVDQDNNMIGIVTENDLIKQNKRLHIPTLLRLFDALVPLQSFKSVEEEIKVMAATTISQIYTKEVISVEPEASLQDIATIMAEKGIHTLPVLSSGKLVGIIGRIDVIKGTLGGADQ